MDVVTPAIASVERATTSSTVRLGRDARDRWSAAFDEGIAGLDLRPDLEASSTPTASWIPTNEPSRVTAVRDVT